MVLRGARILRHGRERKRLVCFLLLLVGEECNDSEFGMDWFHLFAKPLKCIFCRHYTPLQVSVKYTLGKVSASVKKVYT